MTLPGAFGCFTLLAFFVRFCKGRLKAVATAALVVLGVAATVLPIVLFVLAIIGICDCVIDIRHWVLYILSQ